MSPRNALVAAGLSGLLYAALLPPLSLGVLAWVALVPLLVAASRSSPAWAAAAGALWAAVATLGAAWWLPAMLQGFFGASTAASWAGLAAAAAAVCLPPYVLFAVWISLCARRRALTPWAVAAAWCAAEYVRAHGWLGNPVALLGYSQTGTPFAQLADLAGPYGIAFLIIAVNAAIAGALGAAPLAGRRPGLSAATVALAVVAALVYGQVRLGQRFDAGPPLSVAAVQGGIARPLHWDRSRRPEYLERYLELTRGAVADGPQLVFWPEFAVDFYLVERSALRDQLFETVRDADVDLVTGAAHYWVDHEGTHYTNAVFHVDRRGALAGRYDKRRLVPFAEYGPFGSWLKSDTAVYEAGSVARVLPTAVARVGALVCGEALFPELARALANAGAELLANPSNDYWFGHPAAQQHQLQMASLRAIENRRYLVRATATGVSALVDPHGRALARSRAEGPEVLSAVVHRSSAVTAYQRVGDAPWYAALLFVFLRLVEPLRSRAAFGGEG